ncbi:MAG: hypothetical protein EPO35_04740 [Acidobacteria bacterium]|nr:MAG: hypothetical protein EPO35_04740 [Acidobacteriota bacterium]
MSSPGGSRPVGGPWGGSPAGASLIEITVAMGITSLCALMSAPVLAGAADAGRAREAAQYLAAECRSARMEAVARNAASSLVFDLAGSRWRFRRCLDGNGNGMRRAEISSGRDTCRGSLEVSEQFSGVRIGVLGGLPDPDGGPGATDPVRFGSSDIATFTPLGTATSGTVYLRSDAGAQYAIRVAGTTGRVRILRFDVFSRVWTEV